MEEKIQIMKPFTKSDKEQMKQAEEKFCNTCAFLEDCTTIDDQNIKSQFRDGISNISEIWGCTIHTTEDEFLENIEERDENNDI